MKKIIVGSVLCLVTAAAFARGGYYHARANGCDAESMRRALDDATVRGRAVITTVRCDAAPVARPAYRVYYVQNARPVAMPCCADCRY